MDVTQLAVAAAQLRELVSGDGADLRLVRVDARAGQVALELDLSAAGCSDCVLPPPALRDMVDASLKRSTPGDYDVTIYDPREPSVAAPSASDQVTIIEPAAQARGGDDSPGPDAGDLRGKTLGFRVDVLWRSWDWVVDEWTKCLAESGVRTVLWRRVQGIDGDAGQTQREEFAEFLESVDAAVVGLGNCGSCTSWTIKDAVAALNAGRPTVAVSTAHFEQLARTLAGHYQRPGLRVHALPYPLDTRPEDEVRKIARETYGPLLALLGAVA